MNDLNESNPAELSDEELDQVAGGVSVGDRVKMDSYMVRYCPGCGKLASIVAGTVVGKMYYEKGGYYFVDVRSDCCGHAMWKGHWSLSVRRSEISCFSK